MSLKTVGPKVNIFKSLLRPNDATQYALGDVLDDTTIPAQTVFNDIVRFPGGTGTITDGVLTSSANGVGVLAGQFNLWLFDTAVAAHEADNVAFTPTDNDLVNLIGIVRFNTAFEADRTAGADGNVAYMSVRTFLPIGFKCVAASRDLFGTLVVANAYTPIAFEVITIRLNVEQD